ncbi:MAG: prolyl-tRNA synthetase associated domain-containing protein [Pseudomonadota bacterium]
MGDGTAEASTVPTAEGAAAEAALYALFETLGIAFTHHVHPPFHTVEDSRVMRGDQPGAHVKNMFLKEKKGGLWLVTCLEDRAMRIRDLEKAIGAKNVSFGKPDLLWDVLRVRPGAVTPFALMVEEARQVRFVLDAGLAAHDMLNAHPLHNRATTAVRYADFRRFLAHVGHDPLMLDMDPLEAAAEAHAAGAAS